MSSWGITVGLAAGWIGLAVLQSALVIGITWAAFGVTWGDPMAASALVVVYGLVGCGAGLLVGVIGNDVDRVAAVTPVIGLITAALGGCMMPIEIFPPTMVTIAHAAPQYWALRAWYAVIYDGVGLGGVAVELAVLSGFAVVLLAGAALGLTAALTAVRSVAERAVSAWRPHAASTCSGNIAASTRRGGLLNVIGEDVQRLRARHLADGLYHLHPHLLRPKVGSLE